MDDCRLIVDSPANAFRNMAVDEALFRCAAESRFGSTLRIYGWSPPAVSLGRRQKYDEINIDGCMERGLDVVRRTSGGSAVYHSDEITYSFVSRLDGAAAPDSEKWRQVFCGMLEKLGLKADPVDPMFRAKALQAEKLSASACFSYAQTDEPAIGGRKWVGGARRKNRLAFMQHGSILLKKQPPCLNSILNNRQADRSAGLLELDAGLQSERVCDAFIDSLCETFDLKPVNDRLLEKESELAKKLESEKADEWEKVKKVEKATIS